jgi:hypothetical protein
VSIFDDLTERLSRRAAARTSRRTFLARVGQTAVLVAGGPALATLLVERAEARVCGQSGVAPKCPTFDCSFADSTWGWCWYASAGCCANGGLKKICDCCTKDWSFVHGYCPAGHNVRCIVESCYADPRVQTKPIERALGLTPAAVALARSRTRAPGSGGIVVLGDSDDLRLAAVAGPVAALHGAPLLLTGRNRLATSVIAEVQRLGATKVIAVGAVPQSHLDELERYGVATEHTGLSTSVTDTSVLAARHVLAVTNGKRVMCIGPSGVSAASAAAAAAVAGQLHMPLVVGVDGAIELDRPVTWLVGPEPIGRADEVRGAVLVDGATKEDVAIALATRAVGPEQVRNVFVRLAPSGSPDVSVGLCGEGGVLLFHPDSALGGAAYGWIHEHGLAIRGALPGGTLGALGDGGIYDLQSALHRFDTHQLIGVSGQGLPVISQPREERPVGRARVQGAPAGEKQSYWSGRAKPGSGGG